METIVISRKTFTDNLGMYFKKMEKGAQIVLKWGNKQTVISPAEEVKDDTCYTKEEFEVMLAKSMKEAEEGKCRVLTRERRKELLGL
jgi:hypothetical protein